VSGQLASGTLRLEETGNAVTAEQAAALLALWQAIRGGTLQSEAESGAVLKQIEGTMSPEQLAAIAAVQLTWEDLGIWAENQGLSLGMGEGPGLAGQGRQLSAEVRETLQAQFGDQPPGPEARATLQAQIGSMSQEEREAARATAEASGGTVGGKVLGGGLGQLTILLDPLIELLTERAAA